MVVVFILFRCYFGGGSFFIICLNFLFFPFPFSPLGDSEKINTKNNYGYLRDLFTGL